MKCLEKSMMTPEEWQRIKRKKLSPEEFREYFPIVGFWVKSGGIVLVRECGLDSLKDIRTGKRQKVTGLSSRSLYRLALLALSTETPFKSLYTLTYGPNFPLDGTKVKYHLNFFITKLKRSYGQFDYLWFLEFQQRGAPHFHILLTLPAPGRNDRIKIAAMWADIVESQDWPYSSLKATRGKLKFDGSLRTNSAVRSVHEHPLQLSAIRRKDGAKRYMVKYATKLTQKIVPKNYRNVGRFWGKARG